MTEKMENNIYEKGSLGTLKEQAKKDGFNNIRDWQNSKRYKPKNIDQVKKILTENKIYIKDSQIFYRFWSKVDIKDNKKDCWNWTAGTTDGYGTFWLYDKQVLSNRMSYTLTKGDIKDESQVQHICNNRLCCNPSHLELGNHYKNMQYMVKCRRSNYGENNGFSKLTEDHVRLIFAAYIEQQKLHPEFTQYQIAEPIAEKFNISCPHIISIINGRQWKHMQKDFGHSIVKNARQGNPGESNGNSKLTEDQVREIHNLYKERLYQNPYLIQWEITEPIAKKFNVSKVQIGNIINGKQWHHIYKEFHQK